DAAWLARPAEKTTQPGLLFRPDRTRICCIRSARAHAGKHAATRTNRQEERRMKFGIFYELQLPRPWQAGDEHRLYLNALEQIELADRLGLDHALPVGGHFLQGDS